ncbi:MAG: S-adenosylmethionine:tRNA ribosyltransferase-isomerase [Bacteroidales bacterium]|nr:S-adenosylmethionine:tRNA ribosyltransferase-isomerase [Bacteroidales bacterium]
MAIPHINIHDYNYPLPDERIAKYPLEKRDSSNLLIYNGKIGVQIFREITSQVPSDALMVFNNTKVVPARMHFCKPTGALIEIFALEPVDPIDYNLAFSATEACTWKCLIGNAKKWKDGLLSLYNPSNDPQIASLGLTAELLSREGQSAEIRFKWSCGLPFSAVLDASGTIPIPPYLNRDTENIDLVRYQTTYARHRGSVAAPTAGLHFTPEVLKALEAKGVDIENVCLHVGAGTFLPVKEADVASHHMHRELFTISRDLLQKLIAQLKAGKPVVSVGTTSIRTLESLYYAGVDCIEKGFPEDVKQWAPYDREYQYTTVDALEAIVTYLNANNLEKLSLGTRIIIVPGFKFRIVDILVTNFHQPQSTLLLLISAFVGDVWKDIYRFALENGFRFLSYGDSSILFRAPAQCNPLQ